jgi:hypothetical protein
VLFNKAVTALIDYPAGKTGSYVVPGSVITIGIWQSPQNLPGPFASCFGLTSVTIPDSVTLIGQRAFLDCTSLTGVDFGNGVNAIASLAFQGCTNLTTVTIPDSVAEIGDGAFSGCSSLTLGLQ